jgi:hypothetical protein
MSYLTTYGGMEFKDAEKLIKCKRSRVAPSDKQIQLVKVVQKKYKHKIDTQD